MSNKMDRPLVTVDGRTLMDRPLEPPNFVVDTLISQGLHILAGSPKVGKSWLALVAGGDGGQGRTGLGNEREAGHHPLSLPGGLRPSPPEPPLLRHRGRADSVHFCTECAPIGQGWRSQVEGFLVAHRILFWSSSIRCRWSAPSTMPPTPMTTGTCPC